MTLDHQKAFEALFSLIYRSDKRATELSFMLLNVAHTWDDLVDRDVEVTPGQVDKAFFDSIYTIQAHPLWGPDMAAVFLNVYLRWSDANVIEQDKSSTDNDLAKAWMLRAGLYDLFVMIAAKLFGIEWAKHVGPTVRRAYGETLTDFIEEIRNA